MCGINRHAPRPRTNFSKLGSTIDFLACWRSHKSQAILDSRSGARWRIHSTLVPFGKDYRVVAHLEPSKSTPNPPLYAP